MDYNQELRPHQLIVVSWRTRKMDGHVFLGVLLTIVGVWGQLDSLPTEVRFDFNFIIIINY